MMIFLKYNKKNKMFNLYVHSKLVYNFTLKKSKKMFISNNTYNYLYVNKVLRSLGLVSSYKNKNDFYN